ncbi:hypothetical protein D3C77_515700 [compost metagenome]
MYTISAVTVVCYESFLLNELLRASLDRCDDVFFQNSTSAPKNPLDCPAVSESQMPSRFLGAKKNHRTRWFFSFLMQDTPIGRRAVLELLQ